MSAVKRIVLIALFAVAAVSVIFAGGKKEEKGAAGPAGTAAEKRIKAGFIYVGPIGDYGFSHAHDQGRLYVEKKFPWLDTVYVEAVAEADCPRIIDRLIQEQKCDVVFTCSFGYMDATVAAGAKYPDKLFMHCSGFKQAPNVGTYFADFYQIYYLNGLMAGALSKSNKIGYVGAFPIPEVVRHIDAFALGVKAANPAAKVSVRWIYAWYGPDKAKEAAEALIAEGCDAIGFTEDTPAVVEAGQSHTLRGKPIYTFSHYSPMQSYGPDSVVSGQLVDWGVMYDKILSDIYNGTWSNKDMFWLAADDAALLGGEFGQEINPKYESALKAVTINTPDLGSMNAYDLVLKRYEQMRKTPVAFEPFIGPIKDNKGNIQVKAGETASLEHLLGMMYYVDNILGDVPTE